MEAVYVPVVLPKPGGLGVHCNDGYVLAEGVFELATGERRKDVVQLRLFCGADPYDVEAEVVTCGPDGLRIKRLRGKDFTFSLSILGV